MSNKTIKESKRAKEEQEEQLRKQETKIKNGLEIIILGVAVVVGISFAKACNKPAEENKEGTAILCDAGAIEDFNI